MCLFQRSCRGVDLDHAGKLHDDAGVDTHAVGKHFVVRKQELRHFPDVSELGVVIAAAAPGVQHSVPSAETLDELGDGCGGSFVEE